MSAPSSPSATLTFFGAPLDEVQLAAARDRRSPSTSGSSVSTPRHSDDVALPTTHDDTAPRCHFRSTTLFEVEGRESGEVWLMSDDAASKVPSEPLSPEFSRNAPLRRGEMTPPNVAGLRLGAPSSQSFLEPGMTLKAVSEMLATSAPPTPDHLEDEPRPWLRRPVQGVRRSSALRYETDVPPATPPLAMAAGGRDALDTFTPFNSPEGAGFGGPAMPSFGAAFDSPSRSSFGSVV